MNSVELSKAIVTLLDSKKAKDIIAIEVKDLTTLGDYFIIASGSSTSQVKAMAEEVEDTLGRQGIEPKQIEGYSSSNWILLDYRDVIVHLFLDETREFYSLERLWADAPKLDLAGLVTEN